MSQQKHGDKLAALPEELRELVASLPSDKQEEVLRKLVQSVQINYKPLQPGDVQYIQASTEESKRFGFLSTDLEGLDEDMKSSSCIALGAYDARGDAEGAEVVVGFSIGELCKVEDAQVQLQSSLPDGEGTAETLPGTGPDEPKPLQQLLSSAGLQPSDMAVAVKYVGIDYEYRGQGIGQELVSLMQQVGSQARARLMYLTVAEHNTRAREFWERQGFTRGGCILADAEESTSVPPHHHHLYTRVMPASGSNPKRGQAAGRRLGIGKSGSRGKASRQGRGFGAGQTMAAMRPQAILMPPALLPAIRPQVRVRQAAGPPLAPRRMVACGL